MTFRGSSFERALLYCFSQQRSLPVESILANVLFYCYSQQQRSLPVKSILVRALHVLEFDLHEQQRWNLV
jgi:hypothetical protein